MPGPTFLAGERVTLRTVEAVDLPFVRENLSDPAVWGSLDRTRPMTGVESEEWLRRRAEDDAVLDLLVVDESPVGFVSLRDVNEVWGTARLSFWVTPDAQGRGYGSDAVERLTAYAFDQRRCHKLLAHVFEDNEASAALLEGVGFEREGVHRKEVYRDGAYWDLYTYGLLAEEYDTHSNN